MPVPPNPGIFDAVLLAFTQVLALGWLGLTDEARWLLSQVATWYLVAMLSLKIMGVTEIIPHLAIGMVKYMGLAWVILNLQRLSQAFLNTVVGIGMFMGGNALDLNKFFSPGTILWECFNVTYPIYVYVEQLPWYKSIGAILIYDLFVLLPMWASYFFVAAHIIVAIIEFQIVALFAVIPIATAIFSGTAFLARNALSGIIASGMRLGVLAFVTGVILPWVVRAAVPMDRDPSVWDAISAAAVAVLLAVISWSAPKYAVSLWGGGPAVTGQALVGMAVGAVGGAQRGYRAYQKARR